MDFVVKSIVNDLDRLDYNTRYRLDSSTTTLEFLPQGIGTMRVNPIAPSGKLLGSRAIYHVMDNLSRKYRTPGAIDIALNKERMEQSVSEDRYVMRMKSQKAGRLFSAEEIRDVVIDSLREHVTVGDHVVEPNMMSEAWQFALQEAADELQRRLIERVPINNSIRCR